MDIRKVKKLIQMLEESDLEEIEIQEGKDSVKLVKKQSQTVISGIAESSESSRLQETVIQSSKPPTSKTDIAQGEAITSPMVGTFYAGPSPGTKPFISVGDVIQEGDIVCIVEAMKMMNEIKSDFSGTVTSVLVENSEPVEFGQTLFLIA